LASTRWKKSNLQERIAPNPGTIGKFIPSLRDRAQEVRFRASRATAEQRETRATLILFIIVNSSFAVIDVILYPEVLKDLLLLRLVLANAVLVAFLALSFVPGLKRRIAPIFFVVTFLYVVFYAFFCETANAPPLYVSGIVMLFFGIYTIAPLRYAEAVVLG
jgi:hypothetical protein